MGALFLLNFVLLAIPIATTLGVLLGIQSHRAATGQDPLFKPDRPTGPGGAPPNDNGITIEYHCDEAYGISPLSQGDHYTLNPNPWGWNEGDPGSLCMNVTTFNNQTYATDSSAPEWSVTWQYPPGPSELPVHAFPNVMVHSQVFPQTIRDITSITMDFEWSYAMGNDTSRNTVTDEAELKANNVNANVAMDMFLDKDKKKSPSSEDAAIEVMVWFATFGPATQPLGLNLGAKDTMTIDGATFSLYVDYNEKDQNVMTWYSDDPIVSFHGDLKPLLERLIEMGDKDFPSLQDYIGYMSLGSETLSSDEFVTFHVPELAIDIKAKD